MADVTLSSIKQSPLERTPNALMGRATTPTNISTLGLGSTVNQIDSGAVTADTWKTVLSLSAPGVLKFCALTPYNSTARTCGLRVLLDGVEVYAGSRFASTTSHGLLAVGAFASGAGAYALSLDRVPFNTLSVQVKSSLTENGPYAYVLYDLV